MQCLQLLDGLEDLPNLVGLRASTVVLDVHTRIAEPWSSIDAMARTVLARRAEVLITDSTEVAEAHALRTAPHACNDLIDASHVL